MFDPATVAYLVLSILGGQVCIPIFLATCLFSRRVHRNPLLLGFMSSWTVYSLATCILLYSGHQGDKEVNHALCLAQAATVNGSLIMAAISAFILVLHLRITMPRPDMPLGKVGFGPMAMFGLAAIPPLSLIIYLSTLLGIEGRHPGLLQAERRDLICGFRSTGAAWYADRISPIIIGVLLLVSCGLSSFLFTTTYSWRSAITSRSTAAPWMRIMLRFTIFTVYAGLTMIACIFRIVLKDSMALHTAVAIYVATLPLAAFLVFGTLPVRLQYTPGIVIRELIPRFISGCPRRVVASPRCDRNTTPGPTPSMTIAPWDMRDPDEMGSYWSDSAVALPRDECTTSERYQPESRVLSAAQMPAPATKVSTAASQSTSPSVTRPPPKKTGNVLRKAGLMRSGSGSKQAAQLNLTGTSGTGDAPSRPHLAEAYYAGRIAREYYAEQEREASLSPVREQLRSPVVETDHFTAPPPRRSNPSKRHEREASLSPVREQLRSPVVETDHFTAPPPRRSNSSKRHERLPRISPTPRQYDDKPPFSQYTQPRTRTPSSPPPRRPASRPISLFDPNNMPEPDDDGWHTAGSSPVSLYPPVGSPVDRALGSPTGYPLLSSPLSPARSPVFEYPTMPTMAPRAAYATHHYMAVAPVRTGEYASRSES
ncbi:hypothetical protein BKA62DRAFT_770980 [Auriculariales sp. MPI-PUGE-AT-0066]|nr:hypothetical protein BKA62DRAFT_770980 [Auriculariales sp. MPI-PUGE-AT-0066]